MDEEGSCQTNNSYATGIPLIAEIEEWFDEELNFGLVESHVDARSEKSRLPSQDIEFDWLPSNGPASVRSSVSSNSSVDDVFDFDMPETPLSFCAENRLSEEAPPRSVSSVSSSVDDVFDFDFESLMPSHATLNDLSLELGIDLCSGEGKQPATFKPLVPPSSASKRKNPVPIAIAPKTSRIEQRLVSVQTLSRLQQVPAIPVENRQIQQDEARLGGLRPLRPRTSTSTFTNSTVPLTNSTLNKKNFEPPSPRSKISPTPASNESNSSSLILAGPKKNYNQTAENEASYTGCIFNCKECGKVFTRRDAARACSRDHRLTSKSLKVLQRRTCSICKKICSSPVALKTHMLIHSGEKPFKCFEQGCNKECREKSALKKHYKRFHPEKLDTFESLLSVHLKKTQTVSASAAAAE